jgi:hypothetical protein
MWKIPPIHYFATLTVLHKQPLGRYGFYSPPLLSLLRSSKHGPCFIQWFVQHKPFSNAICRVGRVVQNGKYRKAKTTSNFIFSSYNFNKTPNDGSDVITRWRHGTFSTWSYSRHKWTRFGVLCIYFGRPLLY